MLLSRKLLAGFLFIFPNVATNVNVVSLKGNLITSTKFSKRVKKSWIFLRGNLNYIIYDYLYSKGKRLLEKAFT